MSFLASVTSLDEARLAVAGGADIVDAKNPAAGALGALPLETIRAIRGALPGIALSATVGDPVADPARTIAAVTATAATGVDFVKVGFTRGAVTRETIARLGTLMLPPCRLVGVLIADHGIDIDDLPRLAAAGFAGVMVDTDDKSGRPLPELLSRPALEAFIGAAHAVGMFAGLAGALRLPHIAALRALGPDILGFRGALCAGERRTASLDPAAIALVRRALAVDGATAATAPAQSAARPALTMGGSRLGAAARLRAGVERRMRERVT